MSRQRGIGLRFARSIWMIIHPNPASLRRIRRQPYMQEGISTARSRIYYIIRRGHLQISFPFIPLVRPPGATCAVKSKAVLVLLIVFHARDPTEGRSTGSALSPSASAYSEPRRCYHLCRLKTYFHSIESIETKPLTVSRRSRLKPRGNL